MDLIDTHCHIHSKDYPIDPDLAISNAEAEGVHSLICVGTNLKDSVKAVEFAKDRENVYPSIGLHPHHAKEYINKTNSLEEFTKLASEPRIVAIGECGLDYYYDHSDRESQRDIFEFQIDIAIKNSLPLIFHIRSAFDDFWPIIDNFQGVKGVIHSFTAGPKVLQKALDRGLMIGLNGIMTFTKDLPQLESAKLVPSENLLLETDAPFLTPTPYRGKICEPKYVRATCEFLAKLRSENIAEFAKTTTDNAKNLFKFK